MLIAISCRYMAQSELQPDGTFRYALSDNGEVVETGTARNDEDLNRRFFVFRRVREWVR